MNLEPRTLELSRSNFDAAIETFLRSQDAIKDSETPKDMTYTFGDHTVHITVSFVQQENNQTVDLTVH